MENARYFSLVLAFALAFSCVCVLGCASKQSENVKTVSIESSSSTEGADAKSSLDENLDIQTEAENAAAFEPESPSSFWGIWIGAFSDPNNADAFVADAQSSGLSAGQLISSEWTNLNQNAYHVVYVGTYSSEAEAENDLASVQSMGYADAYVKYTGDYKG